MRGLILTAAIGVLAGAASAAIPEFKAQELDKSLKVGYGVRIADLNGDKKPDIVIADSTRVIWLENPGGKGGDTPWKLHTVIENKDTAIKTDNVCLAVHDIDGDGKPDIFLGADWQPSNTKAGGSLHWLRQGDNIDTPWKVTDIAAPIPTLHRVHVGDVDGDGKGELIVGPLHGPNATAKGNWVDGGGVQVILYKIPADPAKSDAWKPQVINDTMHVMHNYLPVHPTRLSPSPAVPGAVEAKAEVVITASYEGVGLLRPGADGKWSLTPIGAGDQSNTAGARGSSEIKLGRLDDKPLIATIEPFHGTQVVVYTPPTVEATTMWTRTVLDPDLKGGHAVAVADLDGDGSDEVIGGWRDVVPGKSPVGVNIYQAAKGDGSGPLWNKHNLDKGGMACEDLTTADLDGDGDVDIIAVGRATKNVKVYWNQAK